MFWRYAPYACCIPGLHYKSFSTFIRLVSQVLASVHATPFGTRPRTSEAFTYWQGAESCLCFLLFCHTHQGSFGAAFRIKYVRVPDATQHESPRELACVVKRVDIQRRSFKLIMRESWFLQQLQHRNIACLLYQYMSPNSAPNDRNPSMYLVQEDCGQTLLTFLNNRLLSGSVVPISTIQQVLQGLLSALVYLQAYGVLHRDIKEDNCLIIEEGGVVVAKLIDFGLAKRFDRDRPNFPVALGDCDFQDNDLEPDDQSKLFMRPKQYAPETYLESQFTHKSDLWAVGTLIIWPMLFWACEKNLDKCQPNAQHGRKFPFHALWGGSDPQAYTQEHVQSLIQSNLLDKFPENDDFHTFESICEILWKMYVLEYFVFLWHVWMPSHKLRKCNVWLQVRPRC
jgi:serine/threonine protein kinase